MIQSQQKEKGGKKKQNSTNQIEPSKYCLKTGFGSNVSVAADRFPRTEQSESACIQVYDSLSSYPAVVVVGL